MDLDPYVCLYARLSRDARFDGRFFIGVRSTRVYCRPICPVRTVKEQNVRYFQSAASAAEAGYRPCLRCRPELSPGSPAWSGTSTTVSRALRLISESAMEGERVDLLACRLGIGSRQLRRPFVRHLSFPASDLGLLRGASLLNERELERCAEAWRPWRAYAAMHLWQGADELKKREGESSMPPALGRTAAVSG